MRQNDGVTPRRNTAFGGIFREGAAQFGQQVLRVQENAAIVSGQDEGFRLCHGGREHTRLARANKKKQGRSSDFHPFCALSLERV